MKNTYTVTVTKPLPSLAQIAKDLLPFQLRTGFPIRKALELYKRPMAWEFTNRREAQKWERMMNNDGTGRTATLTISAR
jgi:hypothetical protein